jgi:hypothetical protein
MKHQSSQSPAVAIVTMFPITPTPKKPQATTEIPTLQDCVVPGVVSPLAFSVEPSNFWPFGLGCQICDKSVTIQFNLRSIQIHLKKHGMEFGISNWKIPVRKT